MAVTAKFYGKAFQSAFNKEIDFDTDTVKHMLVTSSYTPNQDTHRYHSDISGEAVGTGYTAGGVTATGKSVSYDAGTNTFTLDCDDPTWATTTLSNVRYLVTYVDTGTSSTSALVCYMNFGVDQTTTATPFVVTLSSSGLAYVTVS